MLERHAGPQLAGCGSQDAPVDNVAWVVVAAAAGVAVDDGDVGVAAVVDNASVVVVVVDDDGGGAVVVADGRPYLQILWGSKTNKQTENEQKIKVKK